MRWTISYISIWVIVSHHLHIRRFQLTYSTVVLSLRFSMSEIDRHSFKEKKKDKQRERDRERIKSVNETHIELNNFSSTHQRSFGTNRKDLLWFQIDFFFTSTKFIIFHKYRHDFRDPIRHFATLVTYLFGCGLYSLFHSIFFYFILFRLMVCHLPLLWVYVSISTKCVSQIRRSIKSIGSLLSWRKLNQHSSVRHQNQEQIVVCGDTSTNEMIKV